MPLRVDQAFVGRGSKALEKFGPARKVHFVLPKPREFTLPTSKVEKLTLRQACQRDIAICEGDDSFLIYRSILTVSLSQTTYFKAGIEAERRDDRYVGVYNLEETTGRRLMRLYWAFDHTLTGEYEFIVKSDPEKLVWNSNELYKPLLQHTNDNSEESQDEINEILEWVGLCIVDAPILHPNIELDPSICSLARPGDIELVARASASGVFEPQTLRELWKSLCDESWAVMHVEGFNNGPLAWGKPHKPGKYSATLILDSAVETEVRVVSTDDLSTRRMISS